jgi:hypothetical protein
MHGYDFYQINLYVLNKFHIYFTQQGSSQLGAYLNACYVLGAGQTVPKCPIDTRIRIPLGRGHKFISINCCATMVYFCRLECFIGHIIQHDNNFIQHIFYLIDK